MLKEEFRARLKLALEKAVALGKKYITEELIGECFIQVGQSASNPKEVTPDDVVEVMYGDGFIPFWINLRVYDVRGAKIVVLCEFSGEKTNRDKELYHQKEGVAPFHVLAPIIPPSHIVKTAASVEWNGKKFSIKESSK